MTAKNSKSCPRALRAAPVATHGHARQKHAAQNIQKCAPRGCASKLRLRSLAASPPPPTSPCRPYGGQCRAPSPAAARSSPFGVGGLCRPLAPPPRSPSQKPAEARRNYQKPAEARIHRRHCGNRKGGARREVLEAARQATGWQRWRLVGVDGPSKKNWLHFSICACHPCAGAMLIFSVSFQF